MTAVVEYDIDDVDWLAVEFVCTGTPMRLSGDVPTMAAVLTRIGYDLPVDQLAARMGTTPRQVARILTKLGATHCPLCKRRLILPEDGIVPRHVNCNGRHCRMSGYHVSNEARIAEVRRERLTLLSIG